MIPARSRESGVVLPTIPLIVSFLSKTIARMATDT